MRLSEAIRLGAMLKPQAFGSFFTRGSDVTVVGDVLGLRRTADSTCALGGALDAVGALEFSALEWVAYGLPSRWPVLRVAATCPECGECCGAQGVWDVVAVHLNNKHRWTREQIADWVESIEQAQQPALVTEPAIAVAV